ncbi:MAG: DUF1585 domain-containing protein [Verrucomicrobiia bacterium]
MKDEMGLKLELLERKDAFTRNLIEKFLICATGRELTFRDRAEVEQIARQVASSGYGFRDLVKLAMKSEIFHKR